LNSNKKTRRLAPAGLENFQCDQPRRVSGLAFAELEALARTRLAVFLALAHARIAREQALGDGVDLVQPLTELGARVLVVSGTTDRLRLAETVEKGAVGFLSKTVPFEQLLSTVLEVVAQRSVLSSAQRYELMAELRSARAARSKDLAPFKTLTPKERAVLSALAQGQRAETIAGASVVSSATVRSQIRSVLTKLGVNSQLEAVALAWAVGWFPTAPH